MAAFRVLFHYLWQSLCFHIPFIKQENFDKLDIYSLFCWSDHFALTITVKSYLTYPINHQFFVVVVRNLFNMTNFCLNLWTAQNSKFMQWSQKIIYIHWNTQLSLESMKCLKGTVESKGERERANEYQMERKRTKENR